MLTHAQIWTAIDGLAKRSGLSPSGLAKRAGLDPTTFNKSKRITADGRARWPSTESVAKSLAATGASIDQFVALITEAGQPTAEAPLAAHPRTGARGTLGARPRKTGRRQLGPARPPSTRSHPLVGGGGARCGCHL